MSDRLPQPLVLGVIPARGGSKGILRKNLRLLAGQPLIAHAIQAAKQAGSLDRLIVTTDDEEIRQAALRCGAEAPFLRPKELAEDLTPDLPVFEHVLAWLAEQERCVPEILVHLRPTSPLRRPEDIDEGVRLLLAHPEADSVRSVCTPSQNPFKMWRIVGGRLQPLVQGPGPEPYNTPRQQLPDVWWQTGEVDVTRRQTILGKRSMTGDVILPLVTEYRRPLDLDSAADLEYAELMLAKRARTGAEVG